MSPVTAAGQAFWEERARSARIAERYTGPGPDAKWAPSPVDAAVIRVGRVALGEFKALHRRTVEADRKGRDPEQSRAWREASARWSTARLCLAQALVAAFPDGPTGPAGERHPEELAAGMIVEAWAGPMCTGYERRDAKLGHVFEHRRPCAVHPEPEAAR